MSRVLGRLKAKLGVYENRELEPKEVKQIAHELVVDEKEVVDMNRRIGGDKSLNTPIYNDAEDEPKEQIDMLSDARENIEGKLANKEEALMRRKILFECLGELSEREQFVIKNHILTDTPLTLDEIGAKFDISRERVRQIEKRALEKLTASVKAKIAA